MWWLLSEADSPFGLRRGWLRAFSGKTVEVLEMLYGTDPVAACRDAVVCPPALLVPQEHL